MPSPRKTTDAAIVAAARKLLERRGRDGFAMADVARLVGIRAPSLYNRFADRAALVAAVELEVLHDLAAKIAAVPAARDPLRGLTAQARVYRAFAKAHPAGYALIYDPSAARTAAGVTARATALAPTMPYFAALVGPAHALAAARVLAPFMHGFVAMELAGAFRLGGGPAELDRAFDHGVATIVRGLAQPEPRHRAR